MQTSRAESLLLLAVAALDSNLAAGQSAATIEDCVRCDMHVERIATFGGDERDYDIRHGDRKLVRLQDSTFLAVPFTADHILRLDHHGNKLAVIGRPGSGPGEFRNINTLTLGPGDSIWVHEHTRLQVLGPDGAYVRSVELAVTPLTVLPAGPDAYLMAVEILTPELAGYPLHILDKASGKLRSFADGPIVRDPNRPTSVYRTIEVAGKVAVTSSWKRYELTYWQLPEMTRTRVLRRDVDWFPPDDFTPWPGPASAMPPKPNLFALDIDNWSHTWVVVNRAADDWRPNPDDDTHGRATANGHYRKAIIERIDPQEGRVVGRAILPNTEVIGFAGDALVYSYRESPAGAILVDVWQLTPNPS
ncbi:MAG: hypothetical protein WEB88_03010 [Gemmatimonadota bacterium]